MNTPPLSKHAAEEFARKWRSAENEIQYYQSFWEDFFRHLCGVEDTKISGIEFQYPVKSASSGHQNWIDVYWKNVAIIEHKSKGEDLDKAELQARGYLRSLAPGYRPRTLIISDFANFRIIDVKLNRTHEFKLVDLPENIHRFEHIISGSRPHALEEEITVDQEAAKLMANLYLELESNGYEGHETSVFLVRLLFLLFGDDTKMWEHNIFKKILLETNENGSDVGPILAKLFQTLNTPQGERPIEDKFAVFPYINGGIFSETISEIKFSKKMRVALIDAANYDWATINPTIFGALFQLIKSKEERADLGEHYTSEENINKVIYPLFLDDLQEQLTEAWDSKKKLRDLRSSLSKIKLLDPACGCGNFLVVAYRHLRQMELEITVRLQELDGKDSDIGLDGTFGLAVGLHQLYGIEILEWPSQVARIALFLTDHQENLKLERITGSSHVHFPLSKSASIICTNALTTSWESLLEIDSHTYILGNPPFIGYSNQTQEQKRHQMSLFGENSGAGILDYVNNWFLLSGRAIKKFQCSSAFVSTNSIIQGQQPAIVWRHLYELDVEIKFAHRPFAWTNESEGQAAVHCVIIGFQKKDTDKNRAIYLYENYESEPQKLPVKRINSYLLDSADILISSRSVPLSSETQIMDYGSKPTDGGHLSDIDFETAEVIRNSDAIARKYLKSIIGAKEMIGGTKRFCFWLADASPEDIAGSKHLRKATSAVREMRLSSKKANTRRDADTPSLFQEIRQPTATYLAVPRVSSERREYVPMQFYEPDVILNDSLLSISGANLVTFSILQSRVFTIWNATVSGRLESRFRISAEITYNNFPFLKPNNAKEEELRASATEILNERLRYPDSTLKTLYAIESMPPSLRKVHVSNDKNVLSLYGLKKEASDFEIISRLFELYREQQEGTLLI